MSLKLLGMLLSCRENWSDVDDDLVAFKKLLDSQKEGVNY